MTKPKARVPQFRPKPGLKRLRAGRPPEHDESLTELVTLRAPRSLLQTLDRVTQERFRAANKQWSRPKAIRDLLAQGLASSASVAATSRGIGTWVGLLADTIRRSTGSDFDATPFNRAAFTQGVRALLLTHPDAPLARSQPVLDLDGIGTAEIEIPHAAFDFVFEAPSDAGLSSDQRMEVAGRFGRSIANGLRRSALRAGDPTVDSEELVREFGVDMLATLRSIHRDLSLDKRLVPAKPKGRKRT